MLVFSTSAPEVPRIVIVDFPMGTSAATVTVAVLVEVVEVGAKSIVTPAGAPEYDRDTVPVNPPNSVIVIVLVLIPPCKTFTIGGAACIENPV